MSDSTSTNGWNSPTIRLVGIAGLACLAVAAVIALVFVGDGSNDPDPAQFSATPYEDFSGVEHTLAELGPRPVVLNFFASWCEPCKQEMPDLEAAFQAYGGQISFLGLAREQVEQAREVVSETGVTYPVGVDIDSRLFTEFGGLGMPTTVFLDGDGSVAEVHSGLLTQGALENRIENLLPS